MKRKALLHVTRVFMLGGLLGYAFKNADRLPGWLVFVSFGLWEAAEYLKNGKLD